MTTRPIPDSDALAFCPSCEKTTLLTSAAPSHGRASNSCDAEEVAAVVWGEKSLSDHQNSAEGESVKWWIWLGNNKLFLGLSLHHTFQFIDFFQNVLNTILKQLCIISTHKKIYLSTMKYLNILVILMRTDLYDSIGYIT